MDVCSILNSNLPFVHEATMHSNSVNKLIGSGRKLFDYSRRKMHINSLSSFHLLSPSPLSSSIHSSFNRKHYLTEKIHSNSFSIQIQKRHFSKNPLHPTSSFHSLSSTHLPGNFLLSSLPNENIVATSSVTDVAHKPTEEEVSESASDETADADSANLNFEVSGDGIRQKFLNFFQKKNHQILASSSLVPEDPTVLLTIAGMLQFKPIFLGNVPRSFPRVTTSQKCIRTNDIENVGVTARHHTFFEMLGNFSFGDYFKKEAIAWAWELATKEYGLPVERIWISVFEDDDEALSIWRDEVGVNPNRIKRMGAEDNFWSSGQTGPCGPCSEMYFDFFPEKGFENTDLGDDSRFIEFYNLVFMQYNRNDEGELIALKNKNIDTGMGLERMAQILQKVNNNYETDLIFPIIQSAAKMAKINYNETSEENKTKLKVIGDHVRAVVFLISDGVTSSNIGRGYVLRRLIRRIVRIGKLLNIQSEEKDEGEHFLPVLAKKAIQLSTNIDADVAKNAKKIIDELKKEETKFSLTLERGEKLLEEILSKCLAEKAKIADGDRPVISGKDIFVLYDTYGFPKEITEEIARERGVDVDEEGFVKEMESQRKLAQSAHNAVKLKIGGAIADIADELPATQFLGYDSLHSSVKILALLSDGKVIQTAEKGQSVEIIVDRTPFYAESGGQIGDCGVFLAHDSSNNDNNNDDNEIRNDNNDCINDVENGENDFAAVVRVVDVQKTGADFFLHRAVIDEGKVNVGDVLSAKVNSELRKKAAAHHTATHLLQSALRKVLGNSVSQAGSLVAFERMRFDFNFDRALTESEISQTESLVNGWIDQSVNLQSTVMSLSEAKDAGAIAMFGEKYGDEVRVIDVPGISMELCGGTHVRNTSEIRAFKILSEAGIASGVRRIEAIAGSSIVDYLNQRDAVIKTLTSSLKVKAEEIPVRVVSLQEELRAVKNEAMELKKAVAMAKAEALVSNSMAVGSFSTRMLVGLLDNVNADALKSTAESLASRFGDPYAIVLGAECEGKVSIVVSFSASVVSGGLHAGKLIGGVAKICGGGGGGRPNFAQAGGKLPDKLREALGKAEADIKIHLTK